ncbi:hypothetical protein [Nakamurella sp.]
MTVTELLQTTLIGWGTLAGRQRGELDDVAATISLTTRFAAQ